MKNIEVNTTLGISPGTKEVGLAVLRGTELLYWRNKSFKGEWSEMKLEKILAVIQKVSKKYGITTMAIKTPDSRKGSPALDEVMAGIKKLSKDSKIKAIEYSLNELKEQYIGTTKSGKKDLVAVVGLYDELLHKGRSWDEKYYIKILEAIALARAVDKG